MLKKLKTDDIYAFIEKIESLLLLEKKYILEKSKIFANTNEKAGG
jgi:hypothetical protein